MPENSCKNGLVCVADMAAECFLVFFSDGRIYPPMLPSGGGVCFGIPEFCFAYETQKKKKKKKKVVTCSMLQREKLLLLLLIDDELMMMMITYTQKLLPPQNQNKVMMCYL